MALRVLLLTLVIAVGVFAVVQDRITASGARSYVAQQRDRAAAGEPPVAVAEVMEPAIARSTRIASLAAAGVLLAGGLAVFTLRRSA